MNANEEREDNRQSGAVEKPIGNQLSSEQKAGKLYRSLAITFPFPSQIPLSPGNRVPCTHPNFSIDDSYDKLSSQFIL